MHVCTHAHVKEFVAAFAKHSKASKLTQKHEKKNRKERQQFQPTVSRDVPKPS